MTTMANTRNKKPIEQHVLTLLMVMTRMVTIMMRISTAMMTQMMTISDVCYLIRIGFSEHPQPNG